MMVATAGWDGSGVGLGGHAERTLKLRTDPEAIGQDSSGSAQDEWPVAGDDEAVDAGQRPTWLLLASRPLVIAANQPAATRPAMGSMAAHSVTMVRATAVSSLRSRGQLSWMPVDVVERQHVKTMLSNGDKDGGVVERQHTV